MKILILGGTGFLGPHIVRRAIDRGHEMTLFNRGRTNSDLFPELEKLKGDRDGDLAALEGREWDAVVDTSGYVPRLVGDSAKLLASAVKQYVFVSTVSVYAGFTEAGMTEEAEIGTIEDETIEQVTGVSYGPLKALCEQAATEAMDGVGGLVTNIRPGLIVGPRDMTGRFTYWPVRVEEGGEVLSPGNPTDPVQYIDARDLAEFIIRCIEDGTAGVFNAIGPKGGTTIAELLYGCKAVTGSDATFSWADAEFLEANEVAAWQHMTVWTPSVGGYAGLNRMDASKAFGAGLASRPLAETVRDTLDWYHEQPEERLVRLRGGLPAEREPEVLKALHARDDGAGDGSSDDDGDEE